MNIKDRLLSSAFLLILGIVFTLNTARAYGQLIAQENQLSGSRSELLMYKGDSRMEQSEIEFWMIVPFLHSFGEEEIFLESWMTVPFMKESGEKELVLEPWMAVPFGLE
jgi:hypothetical protein